MAWYSKIPPELMIDIVASLAAALAFRNISPVPAHLKKAAGGLLTAKIFLDALLIHALMKSRGSE